MRSMVQGPVAGALALALWAAGCGGSAAAAIDDPGIDEVAEAFRTSRGIVGLGVGIVVDGEVAYLGGYGLADRDAGTPVDPLETRFRWASISKTLTAVAVHSLDEVGALDLDDPVASHYPAYVAPPGVATGLGGSLPLPPGSAVTVRNLLDHRSGVRHYGNGDPDVDVTPPASQRDDPAVNTGFEWAFDRWSGEPLLFVPGAGFAYSSPAYNLLGAVVGSVQNGLSGEAQSVEDGYTDRIRGLLGVGTGIRADYQWISIPNRSKGYRVDDDTLEVSSTGDSDVSWKLPSGGFLSTTGELAHYCRRLMGDQLLTQATKDEVFTLGPLGAPRYHLGFYVDTRGGRLRVSHGGAQQKVRSHMAFYPDEGMGFVVFSNTYTRANTEPFWVEWLDDEDPPPIRVAQLVNQLEDLIRGRLEAGEPAVQPAP